MGRGLAPVGVRRVRRRIDAPSLVGLQARGPGSGPPCGIVPQRPLRLAGAGRPGRFRTLHPPGPLSHHRLPRPRSRPARPAAPCRSSCSRPCARERNSRSAPIDPDTDSVALPGVGNRRLPPPRPAAGGNALRPLPGPALPHGPLGGGRRAGLPAGGMPPSAGPSKRFAGGHAREVAGWRGNPRRERRSFHVSRSAWFVQAGIPAFPASRGRIVARLVVPPPRRTPPHRDRLQLIVARVPRAGRPLRGRFGELAFPAGFSAVRQLRGSGKLQAHPDRRTPCASRSKRTTASAI